MTPARKEVCYRVAGGACQSGYVDISGCTDLSAASVYTVPAGGVAVAGAVVTPCSSCPAEVVVVSAAVGGPSNNNDREVIVMCDAVTGNPVTVVTVWPNGAPAGTAPIVEAYDQAGAPWVGNISTGLTKCAGGAGTSTSEQFCQGGVAYTRTSFWNASGALINMIWQDALGAVVPAPTTPTLGQCSSAESVKVWFSTVEPTQILSAATIMATIGATKLLGVSVKQMNGEGMIRGALEPTIPFSAGESWSWASGGADHEDGLMPVFYMLAGTGQQRVSVTYLGGPVTMPG